MGQDGSGPAIQWAKGVVIADENPEWIVTRESQVVGSVLLRPEILSAIPQLEPADFCVDEYRRAWKAILGFSTDPHKISPFPVAQAAGVEPASLLRCVASLPTTINAADYARDIRAARALRESLAHARQAMRETDPAGMQVALQRAARAVYEVREFQDYAASALATRMLERYTAIATGQIAPAPKFGIPAMDETLGGLVPEDLQVWAGRPGMGKTAVTMSLTRQAAKAGAFIGYFSLEIGEHQWTPRMLADCAFDFGARIAFKAIMRGSLYGQHVEDLQDAAAAFSEVPYRVSFTASPTVAEISDTCKRWEDEEGRKIDGVVVDYSAFVRDTGQYRGREVKQVGEIFLDLKKMARSLKTCVLAVHQLNRGVESREDKRPTMADLRDSGEIEQHADSVNLLFREEYYLQREIDKHPPNEAELESKRISVEDQVEVITDKNRAGPPGTNRLFISVANNAVRSLAKE
ncbi:putative DnaB domain protein helicase domain protein [uncultured Pleomorphomonas sp.]|uniref:DNA 5'-3' helicase n=1 Tax=uncultured Pleomorphomonas sp. TaxID=442121 RepID=A0A212L271_9HYPH|nr:DnaB-like helicase C-terminal domain-containing protein [uncultured Pleomorphomonas sp.]SCM71645.1 putative DnaB domain protein helicase domain protein [uncultured Pleomorphomonas sp.]